jgi:hypothetical protein
VEAIGFGSPLKAARTEALATNPRLAYGQIVLFVRCGAAAPFPGSPWPLSDLAALREQPELFGQVASTPTAWRVLDRVARDAAGLARLRAARTHARARIWAAGGDPDVELLVIDADATLVLASSDHKEGTVGTYKHTFGFAPLLAAWTEAPLRASR